jgi:hypothetical protein
MKCLFTISLYKLIGDEIGKLKEKQQKDCYATNFLPEWCLKENGKISRTEEQFQFIWFGKEKYYLFDILYIEEPLSEELKQCGMDEIDFNILRKLSATNFDNMYRILPISTHLVFDIEYFGKYEDTECDIHLFGYLNDKKELIKI